MEVFARIFETPTTQVLCYVEYDHEGDETGLHRIFKVDGATLDVKLVWTDHEQDGRAQRALESFTTELACALVEKARAVLG